VGRGERRGGEEMDRKKMERTVMEEDGVPDIEGAEVEEEEEVVLETIYSHV